ncbi:MAG: hypothetical protein AAGA96_14665 [Verrucomicrobiota bacterium]
MLKITNREVWPIIALGVLWAGLTSCRTVDEGPEQTEFMSQTAFGIADENADGRLSQNELAQHLHREALAEFDLNDDNLISAAEWAAAKPSEADNDENFNLLDKNSDSKITQDEAILYITEHVKFGDSFRKVDQNGDFHLHWEEFAENPPESVDFILFSIRQ